MTLTVIFSFKRAEEERSDLRPGASCLRAEGEEKRRSVLEPSASRLRAAREKSDLAGRSLQLRPNVHLNISN